jgi:uncharacterized protein
MKSPAFGIGVRAPRLSSDAEIDALDAVCRRLAGFDDAVSLEWVDGWLAALACAPLRPPADAWLDAMFDDAFERVFADPSDHAQALAALEARLAVLRDQLDAQALQDDPDAPRLDPVMFEWSDDDRRRAIDEDGASEDEAAGMQTGAVWAMGVLDGVEALAALGALASPVDDDARAELDELLVQVEALTWPPASAEWARFAARYYPHGTPPTRDELVGEACFALQELRLCWLDHAPRPPQRRVAATPGRNDPCPCGSGKKYKKCHGASA